MTHIVNPSKYPTKKALKEAFSNGQKVYLDDPSMFNPKSGYIDEIMQTESMITVTNHPKRSWFACIKKKNGKIVIE